MYIRLGLIYIKAIVIALGFYAPLICHAIVLGTTDTPSTTNTTNGFSVEPSNTLTNQSYNKQAVTSGPLANTPSQIKPSTPSASTDNKVSVKAANQKDKTKTDDRNEKLEAVPQTPEDIAEIMIETTNVVYKDRCACPYNGDKDGFECGVESLYYKSGGHRITCYPQDFRGQQFIFYRKNAN